jgi:hypothetical protein
VTGDPGIDSLYGLWVSVVTVTGSLKSSWGLKRPKCEADCSPFLLSVKCIDIATRFPIRLHDVVHRCWKCVTFNLKMILVDLIPYCPESCLTHIM